ALDGGGDGDRRGLRPRLREGDARGGHRLPARGRVFVSVKDEDKRGFLFVAKKLADLGFHIVATEGTWRFLRTQGIEAERVNKIHEGRPHVVDLIKNRGVDLVLNTPLGKVERSDDAAIRAEAVLRGLPCVTTLAGASALVGAIEAMRKRPLEVAALQDWHGGGREPGPAAGSR
ncbi:MAG: hypothetical protein ACREIU_07535, partial [Planctomycetota bacterium]